jgi:hypothetical protein
MLSLVRMLHFSIFKKVPFPTIKYFNLVTLNGKIHMSKTI